MFKGLGDMGKLMKQAQEMQGKMEEAQAKLDTIEVEGGKVSISLGKGS